MSGTRRFHESFRAFILSNLPPMDTKMQVSSLDETLTGELDIKKAFRSVWLVKVPAFIFDLWKNSPSNAPLGTVTVAEYSNSDPQVGRFSV